MYHGIGNKYSSQAADYLPLANGICFEGSYERAFVLLKNDWRKIPFSFLFPDKTSLCNNTLKT